MSHRLAIIVVGAAVLAAACGKKQPPVVTAPAPAPATTSVPATIASAPTRVDEPLPVPPQPAALSDEGISGRSIEDLNLNSPLKPVYFQLDSADLDATGRAVATANAEILKKNPTWVITIEGHCDERGSAEYNLALGERRAQAAKNYLMSLGIAESRLKTVSYGKEYPFDPGHSEDAWSQNRRGHFVITSK